MIDHAISHYHNLKKLGAGGMGEVYLAEDTQLDRRVAIKVLPSSSVADQQAKRRLVREAQAAAKLDHPDICSIYEVSEEGGTSFIVMQYVDGDTLASRLHLGRLGLRDALNIAAQTADALAEAHSRGIIHRDIKPQNIMITSRGQVKVMDFGLAKAVAGPAAFQSEAETASMLTEPGMIVGTVPYMSPEQLKNEPLDARSDIFSFGAVLYEMVSGRQPFADTSTAATIAAILTREPPPLARYSTEAPAALGRVTARALSKDREQRYQTMRDLATDLAACDREYEKAQANAEPGVMSRDETIGPASDVRRRRSLFSRPAFLAIALPAMAAAIVLAYVLIGRGAATARQPEIRSLAVLPLEDLSGDPAQEYFADGMTDALNFEERRPVHFALLLFTALFAVIHWAEYFHGRRHLSSPLLNSLPFLVFVVTAPFTRPPETHHTSSHRWRGPNRVRPNMCVQPFGFAQDRLTRHPSGTGRGCGV